MTSLSAMTYIIGYLTSIAAVCYFVAIMCDKPVIANRVAYWFFLLAIAAKSVAIIMDWTLR
jgi:hypothetical protein